MTDYEHVQDYLLESSDDVASVALLVDEAEFKQRILNEAESLARAAIYAEQQAKNE